MGFKMKNPLTGQVAKAAGSPHKFGIAGEMKGIDSASRGTKGIGPDGNPLPAKRKFRTDVRDADFVGKGKNKRGTTTATDKIKAAIDEQDAKVASRQGTKDKYTPGEKKKYRKEVAKGDDNVRKAHYLDPKKDLVERRSGVRVKVKGKKDKSTGKDAGLIVMQNDSKTAKKGQELKDIKKVVMKTGSGKHKKKTKVKYDKEGNVKKEVTRRGRLGLRKGDFSVRVGTESGKDVRGAKAAERIVERKTTANIRGRKSKVEGGQKKA